MGNTCGIKFIDMKNLKVAINGMYYLPLIFILLIQSCKKENNVKNDQNLLELSSSDYAHKENIIIEVQFKEEGSTGFNMLDKYNKNYYLSIKNQFDKDTVIREAVPRYFENQIIRYLNGKYDKIKQELVSYPHYYLIMEKHDTIRFEYHDGDIGLIDNSIISLDSLEIKSSVDLDTSNGTSLSDLVEEISNLQINKKQVSKEVLLINDVKMQLLLLELAKHENNHRLIEDYLLNLDENNVDSYYLAKLMRTYISKSIDENNFKDINIEKLTSKSKKLVNFSVYFLLQDKYQHYNKNEYLKKWFYHTEEFKKDSLFFKKSIEPYDAKQFKSLVKLLSLESSEIGKDFRTDNSSEFYLLDFWATWCAPCIQGIKSMKEMDIPDNVQIVNISIDKVKDIEKWRKMERDLGLNMSYWLSDTIEENKEFLKFVEMKSIPRYILIDKDLNLIHQAFYHHNEPEFLSKLNDVKNHESW